MRWLAAALALLSAACAAAPNSVPFASASIPRSPAHRALAPRTPLRALDAGGPKALAGFQAFNTGQFPCSGLTETRTWTNPLNVALIVTKAELWIGSSINAQIDIWGAVTSPTAGYIIGAAWDRYSNPGSLHTVQMNYAPDSIVLHPEETLTLAFACAAIPAREGVLGHIVVVMWYQRGAE